MIGDLGIALVALVDLERGVRPVDGRVEMNRVLALVLVLEEDRQLVDRGVSLLPVVLAGDGPQVEHFEVLGQRELQLVDVRQLIAGRVDHVVVGVALEDPGRVVSRLLGDPGHQRRQVRVERVGGAVLHVRHPRVELGLLGLGVELIEFDLVDLDVVVGAREVAEQIDGERRGVADVGMRELARVVVLRHPPVGYGELIEVQYANPYALEFENFSAAIRGEAEPLLGARDAVAQAAAIEALYRSAET